MAFFATIWGQGFVQRFLSGFSGPFANNGLLLEDNVSYILLEDDASVLLLE